MKLIQTAGVTLSLLLALTTSAFAEDTAAISALSVTEAITNVEKALVEVQQSDFSAANLHLKAARAASEKITGNEAIVKEANGSIIQGQIETKKGDIAKASALLTKGLSLYKSL